jgi:hypothetical protein
MNSPGTRAKLIISEPWEEQKDLTGIITQHILIEGKSFIKLKDELSTIEYILTNRYIGDDVTSVVSGKVITVAIAIDENRDTSCVDPLDTSGLKYIGIGSLRLIK